MRTCPRCSNSYPLTAEHFPRDATKPGGLSYACKPCTNERKRGTRKDRFSLLSDEQRQSLYARQRRYYKTSKGRAAILASVYRKIDKNKGQECDVDAQFLQDEILGKPCAYCGDTKEEIGCDRIDNQLGHTKANVVPCCRTCNVARMDNFTHDEMKVVGRAIAEVKASRR